MRVRRSYQSGNHKSYKPLVLYYSNDILSKALPELGPYISLGITVVNVIMTFPPIFLIERLGRRTLMYGSALGAVLSLLAVGYGLDRNLVTLASLAILTFVTCVDSHLLTKEAIMINMS